MQRHARLGPGKKTNRWNYVRAAKLKPAFLRAGITFCELRFEGCWLSNGLGFAHLQKRRHQPDLEIAVLACNHCHDIAELQGEAAMNRILQKVIDGREFPVAA
jgi:hypothetical protein